MKTYVMFGVKSFTNQLAYRSEVWLRLLGNFVTILIQVEIWKAVIGNGEIEGIASDQMITYTILNTLLYALLLNGVSGKANDSLKSGSIAGELIKPVSYPLYLLADGLGGASYQFLFTVLPSFIIAALIFGIVPPASGLHGAAFIGAILLAIAISFLLGYLISLLAFWLLNHFALSWMMGGLITLFSGAFLPLSFYPEEWQTIAGILPFQFLGYVPAAVYLGTLSNMEMGIVLLKGLAWAALLLLIVNRLWRRAVQRLVVQGG